MSSRHENKTHEISPDPLRLDIRGPFTFAVSLLAERNPIRISDVRPTKINFSRILLSALWCVYVDMK